MSERGLVGLGRLGGLGWGKTCRERFGKARGSFCDGNTPPLRQLPVTRELN